MSEPLLTHILLAEDDPEARANAGRLNARYFRKRSALEGFIELRTVVKHALAEDVAGDVHE